MHARDAEPKIPPAIRAPHTLAPALSLSHTPVQATSPCRKFKDIVCGTPTIVGIGIFLSVCGTGAIIEFFVCRL